MNEFFVALFIILFIAIGIDDYTTYQAAVKKCQDQNLVLVKTDKAYFCVKGEEIKP
jgi:exopolysaccharide biosynthesis protein